MQPSQIAASVPRTNRVVAMGLLKGFCQGFIFSIKGTAIKPRGRAAICPMPNNPAERKDVHILYIATFRTLHYGLWGRETTLAVFPMV